MSPSAIFSGSNGPVVIGSPLLLCRPDVRKILDQIAVKTLEVSTLSEDSLDGVCKKNPNFGAGWSIVLIDQCDDFDTSNVTPKLLSTGFDDVLDASNPEFCESLPEAISVGVSILGLVDQIERNGHLIGKSPAANKLRKSIAMAIRAEPMPVLIDGETGTGKGLVAMLIHAADSGRSQYPMHVLECGSVTDSLFGSELFGHVRGAFTGALRNRRGAFESAGRGVLLMDEVGELQPAMQAFLLTALQDGVYRPVGSDQGLQVECRVIAATNRQLDEATSTIQFRPDLFHRLNGIRIHVPPLRDRLGDVPLLLNHIIKNTGAAPGPTEVDIDVVEFLQAYNYPGNVRELASIVRSMAARAAGENRIRYAHLPFERFRNESAKGSEPAGSLECMVRSGMQMREIETEMTRSTARIAMRVWRERKPKLARTEIVKLAAHSLGVSPRTIYNKLNKTSNSH